MKLVAFLILAAASFSCASQVVFANLRRFLFDVNGDQIDAYGSKIQYFNGSYYLYGNSFSTTGIAFGIKSYSSVDLEHWAYEGFLFDPEGPDSPCNALGGCGRPHMIYNVKSSQYILWVNAGSTGYRVSTSASPSGPFTFLQSPATIDPKFEGLQPADFAIEVLSDGRAYLVFSALNFADPRAGSIWPPIFQTLHISELTPDYLSTTNVSYPVTSEGFDLIDQETESPDIFLRNGIYYVVASNTCGYCNGSIGLVYRSESVQGPWTRQIISGYSCDGQVEGVLSLKNPGSGTTTYVWHSTSVPGGPKVGFGGHIFQPLKFHPDGSIVDLDCSIDAKFPVSLESGVGTVASGAATGAAQSTPLDAAYTAVCDSDSFDLFQTWTAHASGTLASVSVNIARNVQTVPLSLTVFKFSSFADLIGPEYKWTTLGEAAINATNLSYVFNTTTVAVSANATTATVQSGDHLGLAISGADFAPYCHLEYETGKTASPKLYQRGSGQNSWRGLRGKTSVVYERVGKSVKFFATYR